MESGFHSPVGTPAGHEPRDGGPASVEDGDVPAVVCVALKLREPQHVPVEAERLVVVVGCEHQPGSDASPPLSIYVCRLSSPGFQIRARTNKSGVQLGSDDEPTATSWPSCNAKPSTAWTSPRLHHPRPHRTERRTTSENYTPQPPTDVSARADSCHSPPADLPTGHPAVPACVQGLASSLVRRSSRPRTLPAGCEFRRPPLRPIRGCGV